MELRSQENLEHLRVPIEKEQTDDAERSRKTDHAELVEVIRFTIMIMVVAIVMMSVGMSVCVTGAMRRIVGVLMGMGGAVLMHGRSPRETHDFVETAAGTAGGEKTYLLTCK